MPFAVLKSIREVSSEDKLHCASNLLKNEASKKWKTGETGEKSAYVIIEMESAYSIKGIDIGNECSAFVEVLVGGLTCTSENFKEILITCSFMTPTESKTSSMPNRVRCFNREALVKEIADQKWKLIKVICTQPFNRDIKYGLSFIKIHVDAPSGPSEKKKPKESDDLSYDSMNNSQTIGGFLLREDSPDSDSESTSALFNRWKVSKNKEPQAVSTVPRIPSPSILKKSKESFCIKRTASSATPSRAKESPKEDAKLPDRNRNSLLFTDDDDQDVKRDKRKERLEKVIAADQERVRKEKEKTTKKHDKSKEEKPRKENGDKSDSKKVTPKTPASTSGNSRRPLSSPRGSEKAKKPKLDKPVTYRPFNQLLNGVVLVISGIQNPDRATLRSKALALGAKYKPDWDDSCTHLICAFKNTPKYNQVRGKGKIITRSYIEDCHSQKKRLPWRRFALDSAELSKPESEDEIFDESSKPPGSEPTSSRRNTDESDDILQMYDNNSVNHSQVISSGSDTEDEIQKVLAATSPKKKAAQKVDAYEVSTEDEDYATKKVLAAKSPKNMSKKTRNAFEVSTEEEDYVTKKRKGSVPDGSDDDIEMYDNVVNHSHVISSGSDTEDEIHKVIAAKSPKKKAAETRDIFEVTTEEEDYVTKRKENLPDKTTFFKNLKFFVTDQLSAVEKIKVERYIETFEGVLTSKVDEANYVIAHSKIPDAGEFKGETVTPLWILECNESELLIPTTRYLAN